MMKFKYFDVVLTDSQVQDLKRSGNTVFDYVMGLDWSEVGYHECGPDGLPKYRQLVGDTDGILVFHDFGADYYFFAELVF